MWLDVLIVCKVADSQNFISWGRQVLHNVLLFSRQEDRITLKKACSVRITTCNLASCCFAGSILLVTSWLWDEKLQHLTEPHHCATPTHSEVQLQFIQLIPSVFKVVKGSEEPYLPALWQAPKNQGMTLVEYTSRDKFGSMLRSLSYSYWVVVYCFHNPKHTGESEWEESQRRPECRQAFAVLMVCST